MTSTTDTTVTEREAEVLAKVEAELMSGRTFALVAMGSRSITGYQPPTESCKYAQALQLLGRGAQVGDRMAKLVAAIVRDLPLNNTAGETVAKMYQAAGNALDRGFFDTVGNAGPEAGRRRDHEHAYTLADRLLLKVLLANVQAIYLPTGSRHGWAFRALIEREAQAGRLAGWAVRAAGGLD
jgi:hypothetical protein